MKDYQDYNEQIYNMKGIKMVYNAYSIAYDYFFLLMVGDFEITNKHQSVIKPHPSIIFSFKTHTCLPLNWSVWEWGHWNIQVRILLAD